MAQRSSNGRRRFSDKGGKHELDVLAVLSSAFPQWLTSRQIAQRVKAYADSYGELADQAAKAAFAKQFQRDRAKLSAMGIVIESRQPEYSPKTDNQDFASYRLRLGNEPKIRIHFEKEDIPVLAVVNYFVQSLAQAEDFPADISKEPALGLDSIAPGLGIQKIPEGLIEALDSRKYTAAVEINGEKINVVYADSDDLATFMLEHPSSRILTPPVAREAYLKRLEAAVKLKVDESEEAGTHIPIEKRSRRAEKLHFVPQTESEVDRRLKLLLFLSAHMGTDYLLKDLALQFIGFGNKEEEEEAVDLIKRDIGILSTVSDDGEIAGSQFFDVDWDLLENEGMVKTTNSLGLERLAGIPPQYVALLAAGASYLSRSSFLSEEGRASADRLSNYLRQYASPGTVPWLSLTGCEVEPIYLPAIREIVRRGEGMEVEYADVTGEKCKKRLSIERIVVDEGIYWLVGRSEEGEPQNLRISSITRVHSLPKEENKRGIDPAPFKGDGKKTPVSFVCDAELLAQISEFPEARIEEEGNSKLRVSMTVSHDSWFVVFCISHSKHIFSVGPKSIRDLIVARAERELSVV